MMNSGGSFAEGYAIGRDTNGGNNGNNGGNGMWGDGGWWAIILFAMIFGWGNNGWGNNGGGNGANTFIPYAVGANDALTRADLCSEFNFNGLEDAVRGVTQGLCDGFYAMQNSVNGLGTTVMQGFSQSEIADGQRHAALMQQLSNLGYQQKDCCCESQRSIDGVKFTIAQEDCVTRNLMQSNTRDLIENQNSNARAILDALTAQRLEAKDERIAAQAAQIQALQLSASQAQQNAAIGAMVSASEANIIRRTGNDCPIPAYVVPNPNCCYGPYGNFQGYNNSCNNNCCGCGC